MSPLPPVEISHCSYWTPVVKQGLENSWAYSTVLSIALRLLLTKWIPFRKELFGISSIGVHLIVGYASAIITYGLFQKALQSCIDPTQIHLEIEDQQDTRVKSTVKDLIKDCLEKIAKEYITFDLLKTDITDVSDSCFPQLSDRLKSGLKDKGEAVIVSAKRRLKKCSKDTLVYYANFQYFWNNKIYTTCFENFIKHFGQKLSQDLSQSTEQENINTINQAATGLENFLKKPNKIKTKFLYNPFGATPAQIKQGIILGVLTSFVVQGLAIRCFSNST